MHGVSAFPSKIVPSTDKLRGGYYTPRVLANFLADWVSSAGDRLLEPACGDGAILAPLARTSSGAVGIELDASEAQSARRACPTAKVLTSDFFDWFGPRQHDAWDGLAGNPPFIRFQNWTEPTRGHAFDVMRQVGLRPTKLTNAWVPFVVAGALATRPGGRVGLVVPAEIMQVGYAAELRAYLIDEFSELTIITFRRLVFDGILQEVVLLLGVRGRGPARVKVTEVEDAYQLPQPAGLTAISHAPALRHDAEKWIKYLLEPRMIDSLRLARHHSELRRLGDVADVDVGIVTGRNQFFVLRPSSERERSAHLRGIQLGDRDFDDLVLADARCRLLAVASGGPAPTTRALRAYIKEGEEADVHAGYKCSMRKQWWVVPSVWMPDAFLLRQIHDHPRIVANLAGATSTDTIHRVRMRNGAAATSLAGAAMNSATFAFSEVMGRSYGGGVLELEPREAENLPVPDPDALTRADVDYVDGLLRDGRLLDALDYVDDKLLIKRHGFSPSIVADLRAAWKRLRDRRLGRGRGIRKHPPTR